MPLCRSCNGTLAREYFIHGTGPRTQVCVRCALDQGLVTKEEVPTFFDEGLIASRLSVVSRRWGPAITLIMGWTFWSTFLTGVRPWGTYVLVLLGIGTLLLPAQILLFRAKYTSDMSRLTPSHERPKGH